MFLLNLLPCLLTLQLKLKLFHTTLRLRHTPSPSWFSNLHISLVLIAPAYLSVPCASAHPADSCLGSSPAMPCPLGSLTPDSSAGFWAGTMAAVRPSLGLSWGCSPGSEARSPAASSSSCSSSASFSSAGPPGKKLRAATALQIATSAAPGSQAQQALFSLAGVEARQPGPSRRRADLAHAEPSAVRLAGPRRAAGWRGPT